MNITDEMVEKAAMAYFAAVYDEQLFIWVEEAEATKAAMREGARAALEAVAPALIAYGLREAVSIAKPFRLVDLAIEAISYRAQELDPK